MGAYSFRTKAHGKTAREAFDNAVRHAQHESGHGGYTGTIAEKHSFSMQPRPPARDLETFIEELIDKNDKWGPAFCVPLGEDQWLFCGLASS